MLWPFKNKKKNRLQVCVDLWQELPLEATLHFSGPGRVWENPSRMKKLSKFRNNPGESIDQGRSGRPNLITKLSFPYNSLHVRQLFMSEV